MPALGFLWLVIVINTLNLSPHWEKNGDHCIQLQQITS